MVYYRTQQGMDDPSAGLPGSMTDYCITSPAHGLTGKKVLQTGLFHKLF
jgi:hypothetical protein